MGGRRRPRGHKHNQRHALLRVWRALGFQMAQVARHSVLPFRNSARKVSKRGLAWEEVLRWQALGSATSNPPPQFPAEKGICSPKNSKNKFSCLLCKRPTPPPIYAHQSHAQRGGFSLKSSKKANPASSPLQTFPHLPKKLFLPLFCRKCPRDGREPWDRALPHKLARAMQICGHMRMLRWNLPGHS